MQIEPATAEDCHAVAQVHVESWQHAYKAFLPADYLASLSVSQRAAGWCRMVERFPKHLLLARSAGQVVGFVAFGASRDEGAPAGRAEVFAIYVKPGSWSAGVGQQLLPAALQQLRAEGYQSVSLWVIAGNERAIKFYERAGFVAEPQSRKQFELGGTTLEEVRYVRVTAA
ncbi:MAG: GNAT family N-acetyltransferase [Burkholderiaceae bacterium]|nr:GNAT family N-acetyltransferase [Burkholderiaceae bacterium]